MLQHDLVIIPINFGCDWACVVSRVSGFILYPDLLLAQDLYRLLMLQEGTLPIWTPSLQ